MGIVESEEVDNFLNDWINEGDARYIIIITHDKEVIYKPAKSTRGLDTVFVQGLTNEDIGKIKDKIKKLKPKIPIKQCLHYFFDESKDPRLLKPKEEP